MSYLEIRENTQFICWGKNNAREGNRVVDVNESIEVTVDDIKVSSKYSTDKKTVHVYHLREKNCKSTDATLLMIPPTDLSNKLTLGDAVIGDALKITYLGEKNTSKGKPMKIFKLEKEV
jgi:hypothetical protein